MNNPRLLLLLMQSQLPRRCPVTDADADASMGSNIFVSLGEWRESIDSAAFALANNNNCTITRK